MERAERRQHRIMVVDDEAVIITQLEELLMGMGYDVVGKASSGDAAVRLAGELKPDAVLMDIVMPGELDGIAACGRIQDDHDIPVILLTAYGDDAHVQRAKAVRPYGYILKPSQNEQIRATLEIVLEKKAMERTLDGMLTDLRFLAKDRELQLKEIHHRIKNNLNMICGLLSLQALHAEGAACVEALQAVRNRVVSIAKIHEKLNASEHLDSVNVADYFQSVVDSLARGSEPPKGVELAVDCPDLDIEPDKVMPLGLIVTELMSNALKHAYPQGGPGRIRLGFARGAGHYVLELSDDGVGLPPGLDLAQPGSLGLELVGGLVKQVGGTMDVERTGGTRYTVRIPS
ncbi:sensor histidine kinase [Desulfocurvus sp. DL9XJH121]